MHQIICGHRYCKFLLLLAVATVAAAIVMRCPQLASNLWHIAASKGFVLPKESSVCRFHIVLGSGGSGEWWRIGEDGHYCYYNDRSGYRAVPKTDHSASCAHDIP